jgi:hypothetical protein
MFVQEVSGRRDGSNYLETTNIPMVSYKKGVN